MEILIFTNLITLVVFILFLLKFLEYRYSKKTFHRLMDHINIGYYRYRYSDGVVLAANEGFLHILELKIDPKEVVGKSLKELMIYVQDERSVRELVNRKKRLRDFEYHFKTLKGKDKWVVHNSYLATDPRTGEKVIESLIEDITEEKLSYERMKESQERYKKLFVNSGDLVVIFRLSDLSIEEVNPMTEVLTGYSSRELMGKSFEVLIHPSYRKKFKESQEDLIFKGSASLEAVVVCKNGAYKDCMFTMSVVEIEEEKIALVLIKDISEMARQREEENRRKKELEEFWKASMEREERIKDLRSEMKRLQQKVDAYKNKK